MMKSTASRSSLVLVFLALAGLIGGCSAEKQDPRAQFQELVDAGQYKEILARVELARRKGRKSPLLDYYQGVALLAQDEDVPAARAFDRAVAADSSLALKVSRRYREAARTDAENQWMGRATRRMERAYLLDGVVEMGELEDEVAESLFEKKKLKEVTPIYRDLLAKGGDAEQRQLWIFHLGLALEQSGSREAGLESYRNYWKEFPPEQDTRFDGGVAWRQGVILLEMSRERMEQEDYEGALVLLNELLSLPPRAPLRIQAYYLAGQCEEGRGRPEAALRAYKEAKKYPIPGPGGEREKAREKVAALQAAGIH